jgi:hypothetical protein
MRPPICLIALLFKEQDLKRREMALFLGQHDLFII